MSMHIPSLLGELERLVTQHESTARTHALNRETLSRTKANYPHPNMLDQHVADSRMLAAQSAQLCAKVRTLMSGLAEQSANLATPVPTPPATALPDEVMDGRCIGD